MSAQKLLYFLFKGKYFQYSLQNCQIHCQLNITKIILQIESKSTNRDTFDHIRAENSITLQPSIYSSFLMKFMRLIPLLLILKSVSPDEENSCEQSQNIIYVGNNVCQINYSQCPGSVNIIIQDCLHFRCRFQLGGECLYYTYQYFDIERCMNQCCDIKKHPSRVYSNEEVANCLKQNPSSQKESKQPPFEDSNAVILGCLLGIVFLIAVIVCICCKERIRSFCNRMESPPQQAVNVGPADSGLVNISGSKEIKFILQETNQNMGYRKQQQCSICLSGSNQIKTKCGHWFHLKCLSSWLSKNYSCPNCVGSEINPVKAICLDCGKFYAQIKLNKMNKWKHLKREIKSFKCQLCIQKQLFRTG